MPFQIIRNDITKVKADAIVNTANPEVAIGDGVDSAIYKAAGEDKLFAERQKIGRLNPGEVAITSAFNMYAKFIIQEMMYRVKLTECERLPVTWNFRIDIRVLLTWTIAN